jgi:hypothetical protein
MNRNALLLVIVAVVWAVLALSLSYILARCPWWPFQPTWSGRQRVRVEAASGVKSVPTPSTVASRRVQVEVWRTAGEGWTRGQLEGTSVLEEGTGLGLAAGVAQGEYTSPPQEVAFSATALSWEWQGAYPEGSGVTVQVRMGLGGRAWSDWQEIPYSHDDQDPKGPWVSELIGVPALEADGASTGSVGYVQYSLHLVRSPNGASPVVEALALTVLNSQHGPEIKAASAALLPADEDGGVPRPPVISRAGWGADESLGHWEPEYRWPQKVIIHHTVTYNPNPLATVRAIHYYHSVTRHWGDIGYNYLIDAEGNIYEGRAGGETVVAGHARQYNYGSIGIALLGDFTREEVPPPMEAALIDMLAWIADRYGIAPQGQSAAWGLDLPSILGHRDVGSTACPGEQAHRRLPYVRAMAAERLLTYPPAVTIQDPSPGGPLRGNRRVRASSSSPLLGRLELYVDGQLVSVSEESPLVWQLDTTNYGDGEHMLKVVARGIHELNGELTRAAVIDNSPPRGSITIDGGALYSSDRLVELVLAAADVGVGVQDMELAEDGQWSIRETLRSRYEWQLPPGDGLRTLAVRFWDGAGNASPVYTDTISVDTSPPAWDDACTLGPEDLQIGVQDGLSGLVMSSAQYALSSDEGKSWGPWYSPLLFDLQEPQERQMISVPLSVVSGITVRFRIMDRAGNWSLSPPYVLASVASVTGAGCPAPGQLLRWLGREG